MYKFSLLFLLIPLTFGFQSLELDRKEDSAKLVQKYHGLSTTDFQWEASQGPDGSYSEILHVIKDGKNVPFVQTTRQTESIGANKTRVTTEVFNFKAGGEARLIEVSQEEQTQLAEGVVQIDRSVYTPDLNGKLNVIRQEREEIQELDSGLQKTTKTVLTPDIEGKLVPSQRIESEPVNISAEQQEIITQSQLLDRNGRWKTNERRVVTINLQDDVVHRQQEEVYRSDSRNQMTLSERTVTQQRGDQMVTEVYRKDRGELRLDQRVTMDRKALAGGAEQVIRTVEQRKPVSPPSELRVVEKQVETIRPLGGNRVQVETQVFARDGNGNLKPVISRTRIVEKEEEQG